MSICSNRRTFIQTAGLAAGAAIIPRSADAGSISAGSVSIEADVLVCGGGCAGLAAALSSARNGAKTVLIERAGFAGGIITAVGLPYFDGISNIKDSRIIVRGIGFELLEKSGVVQPGATHTAKYNPTISNVEGFKLLADRLLMAEREHLHV